MFARDRADHERPESRGRFFSNSFAAKLHLSIDGRLCALCRDVAPNAMRRPWAILSAHGVRARWWLSRSAPNGRRGVFSPASAARSRDMQPEADLDEPATL